MRKAIGNKLQVKNKTINNNSYCPAKHSFKVGKIKIIKMSNPLRCKLEVISK